MRKALRLIFYALAALALVVVVLNWTYGRLPGEPKPQGSFVTVDGLRIHYFERAGAGTPVVLLHGLPGTAEDWNEVTPLLSGHRTIAIDRPGFGYSSGGYVKFGRQVEIVDDVLRRLHVARPILVGHSYGGTIALAFAERYPSEPRALVLVDAAAGGTRVGSFEQAQAHAVKFLQLPVIHQISNVTFGQLLDTVSVDMTDGKAFHPQPVATAHRHRVLAINVQSGNLEAYSGEELEANGVFDRIDPRLGSIRVPAVVIQGEEDKLVKPKYGRKIAATLPDARLEMVHGGHMAPYTHPYAIAAVVNAVEANLRRAQAATASP
ncbi:MAG TPA: alpha/beta hydrolase [Solirubrobacteraceae bacterium]|jgi:pimeloyl-ACP methyl ester carboxylesterase|nr:alpha/beta hydrolase [Solirubrobacteraceae bacterium]